MLTTALAAAAISGTLTQQPVVAANRIRTFDHIRAISIAAAPTGAIFAAGQEDGSIRILNAATLQGVGTLQGHPQGAYALAFSPDGRFLVSGDETARLFLWDTRTWQRVREFSRDRGHTRGIQAIAWAPNSQSFASIGKDDTIRVWSTQGAHPVHTVLGQGANFFGAGFTPGGGLLTGTLREGLRIYSPNNYQLVQSLQTPGGQGANGIALNRAGTIAVTADRSGTASVWNIQQRARVGALRGHEDWIIHTAVAPSGRVAATSSSDRRVMIWNLQNFTRVQTIEDQSFVGSPIAFTGDGRFFISTNSGDSVQIYQLTPAHPAPAPAAAPRRR